MVAGTNQINLQCLNYPLMTPETPSPTPHCIEWDAFLPFSDGNFASQDYRMSQPQKALAYAKALQYWTKKAQMPQASQPCQLAVCIKEVRYSGTIDVIH